MTVSTTPVHIQKVMGLLLVNEWEALEVVKETHPNLKVCFITLVQCFHRIGLEKVSEILNESNVEYLLRSGYSICKFQYAKTYLKNL